MSSIQRTMIRAMAREGFKHKIIAREKEKQQKQQEKRERLLAAKVNQAILTGNDPETFKVKSMTTQESDGIYVETRNGGIFIHN